MAMSTGSKMTLVGVVIAGLALGFGVYRFAIDSDRPNAQREIFMGKVVRAAAGLVGPAPQQKDKERYKADVIEFRRLRNEVISQYPSKFRKASLDLFFFTVEQADHNGRDEDCIRKLEYALNFLNGCLMPKPDEKQCGRVACNKIRSMACTPLATIANAKGAPDESICDDLG